MMFVTKNQDLDSRRAELGDGIEKLSLKAGFPAFGPGLHGPVEFRLVVRENVTAARTNNADSRVDGGAVKISFRILLHRCHVPAAVQSKKDGLNHILSVFAPTGDAVSRAVDHGIVVLKK